MAEREYRRRKPYIAEGGPGDPPQEKPTGAPAKCPKCLRVNCRAWRAKSGGHDPDESELIDCLVNELAQRAAERNEAKAEVARLRAIMASLPKSGDDMPILPEMDLYVFLGGMVRHVIAESVALDSVILVRGETPEDYEDDYDPDGEGADPRECYSTREAAEAAAQAKPPAASNP